MLKNSLTNIGKALSKQRFVQLDKLLSPETCQLLSKRIHILQTAGKLKKCDQCPSSQWVYEDACYAEVHKRLSEQLSKLLGIELIATFNAVRRYSHHANLPKHRDREACEFSLSVPIDYAGDEQWPLYLADKQEDESGHAVSLAIGDGIILQGAKLHHWRKPLKNQWQIQAFFFFVDAAGKFKAYAGDIIDKYPKQKSKYSET